MFIVFQALKNMEKCDKIIQHLSVIVTWINCNTEYYNVIQYFTVISKIVKL